MRHIATTLVCIGILAWAAAPASAQAGPPLTTESAQDSYALGQQLAESLKVHSADINLDALLRGIRDSLENKPSQLSAQDLVKAQIRGRSALLQKHEKRQHDLRDKHGKEGREFLDRNAKQPGVVTTKDGLQYAVLTPGTGPKPGATSTVRVHYRATLLDGTEVDSSIARGTPVLHRIGQCLRGLSEVLPLMPTGAKYRVVIPPQLGYGDLGLPGKIPPGATLVYELALLEIVK
jgi:FKBP-type peptidyl-prolyl cis-trans isomerase